jgi:serine/threonine protein kinase
VSFETPTAHGLTGSTGDVLVQYEKQLSIGVIGSIWLGRLAGGAEMGRLVSVRRVPLGWLEPEDVERAKLAAGAFARLKNPSLVKLLEVNQTQQDLVCISEYLAGVRLSDLQKFLIETETTIPAGVAVRVVLEAAKAALTAHRLISRLGALTSQRVLFTDGVLIALFGETLLTDVGLLASLSHSARIGSLPAMVANLAPEEILSPSVTCGSPEVFTLGVVLWELLTNRCLFSRLLDATSMRNAVLHQPIAPVDSIERLGLPVPKSVARLVAEAIERNPRKRLGSLEAFVEAVHQLPANCVASVEQLGDTLRKLSPQILPECDASAVWPVDAEHERGLMQSVIPAPSSAPGSHNWDPPTFSQRQLVVPVVGRPAIQQAVSEPAVLALALSLPVEQETRRKRALPIILGSGLFLAALVSTFWLLRLRHNPVQASAEPAQSATPKPGPSATEQQPIAPQAREVSVADTEPTVSEPPAKQRPATTTGKTESPAPRPASSRVGDTSSEPFRPHKISPFHPKGI